MKRAAAIRPDITIEVVSNKSRSPSALEVGADVLLERGGASDALEEAAGSFVKEVLLGVEPLPPMLVLLMLAVEAASEFVVSRDNSEDVAVSIDSMLSVAIRVPVTADEAAEAAELAFEATDVTSDEAPDMIDDAPFNAAEDAEAAAEAAFDSSVDAAIEVLSVGAIVKGTMGTGNSEDCGPMLEGIPDARVVAVDIAEPATLDATMLSCTAADWAASELSATETGASDRMDAEVGMTSLTGSIVTGSVGADTDAGS